MTRQPCQNCAPLDSEVPIPTPGKLTELVEALQELVADGELTCVETYPGNVEFEALSVTGPWDDILGYTFECPDCCRRFSLFCDTYHGRGHWGPAEDERD